jgi:hypothetical protein
VATGSRAIPPEEIQMKPSTTFFDTSASRQSPVLIERAAQHFGPDVALLAQVGVAHVRVEYDGSFDFGTVASPVYLNEQGHLFEPELPIAVRQDVQVFLREWLELRRPGWANAEGSSGELVWNLKTDRLEHSHSLRHIAVRPIGGQEEE